MKSQQSHKRELTMFDFKLTRRSHLQPLITPFQNSRLSSVKSPLSRYKVDSGIEFSSNRSASFIQQLTQARTTRNSHNTLPKINWIPSPVQTAPDNHHQRKSTIITAESQIQQLIALVKQKRRQNLMLSQKQAVQTPFVSAINYDLQITELNQIQSQTNQYLDLQLSKTEMLKQQTLKLQVQNQKLKKSLHQTVRAIQHYQQQADATAKLVHSKNLSICSQQSAARGTGKIDSVLKIIQQLISAKTSQEAALTLIHACKSTFTTIRSITLFVVQPHLQQQFKPSNHCREITADNTVLIAIYDKDSDYCAPAFRAQQQDSFVKITGKSLTFPITAQQKTQIVLQIELDLQSPSKSPSKSSPTKRHSKQFRQSDHAVLHMIALCGFIRIDINATNSIMKTKDMIINQAIEYSKQVMQFTKLKQVLWNVKTQLPQLLNFSYASMYLADKHLYGITLDDEQDRLGQAEFEREFVFNESQVVHFPLDVGVNGFVFKNNAVNYLNGRSQRIYQINNRVVPEPWQQLVAASLCQNYPLNSKSDNLLELDLNLNKHIIICAVIDTEVVGTLQLYKQSEVDQFDLARVSHLRKLIGAAVVNCHHYFESFQQIIGLYGNLGSSAANSNRILQQDALVGPLHQGIRALKRQFDLVYGTDCKNPFTVNLSASLIEKVMLKGMTEVNLNY